MEKNKLEKIIQIIRERLREETGPTMAMSHGQIAGSVESGDDPPVRKVKKERKYLKSPGRKIWIDNLKSSITKSDNGRSRRN